MTTTIETITPEIAAQMLKQNKNNRPLMALNVRFLAEQMRAGAFKTTHQGIAFAKDGCLLDGQNRLQAVIQSGATIQIAVTRDLDESIFSVLDTGKIRTAGDVLHIQGYENSNLLGSTVKMIKMYERNLRGGDHGVITVKQLSITNEQIRQYIIEHPDLLVSVDFAKPKEKNVNLLQPTIIAFVHHLLSTSYSNRQTTELFLSKFVSGAELSEDCPIYNGRQYILKYVLTRKMPISDKVNVVLHAWNNWAKGKKLKRYTMPSVAANMRYVVPIQYQI